MDPSRLIFHFKQLNNSIIKQLFVETLELFLKDMMFDFRNQKTLTKL